MKIFIPLCCLLWLFNVSAKEQARVIFTSGINEIMNTKQGSYSELATFDLV